MVTCPITWSSASTTPGQTVPARNPASRRSIRSAWPSGVKNSGGWAGSHGRNASKSRAR
jgi:hypothetical protein